MRALTVLIGDLNDSPVNTATMRFLTWLQHKRPEITVDIVSRFPGDLHREIGALGRLFVANDHRARRPSGALQTARLHKVSEAVRSRELRFHLERTGGIAYLADLDAAPLLDWLPAERAVVAHLHAEATTRPDDLDPRARGLLAERVQRWIVGRHSGPDELARALGRAPAATDRWRTPFVESEIWAEGTVGPTVADHRTANRRWLLEHRGIPVDPPLIVSGGDVDWWATDNTFVQLCWEITAARPDRPPQALWVAPNKSDRHLWPLRHDISHAGLEHVVHVSGAWPPAPDVLAAADVVVSAGTGPAWPEADAFLPALGVPVVRFDNAPAPPDDMDVEPITVPYLDVRGLRDAVISLVDGSDARARAGAFGDDDPALWDPWVAWPALLELVQGR